MSNRIETDLRTYMSYLESQAATVTLDEMAEKRLDPQPVRPIGLQTHGDDVRPHRRWLVLATSAAAVLLLIGGAALLPGLADEASSGAHTSATAAAPSTLAATDVAAQGEGLTPSVTGNLLDDHYWHGPTQAGHGQLVMSDERISGDVTFTTNFEVLAPLESPTGDSGQYLYWGTMVIENDGGTWEGTHFAADHLAMSGAHAPIVIQLVGHGDYEGFSAILYRIGHDSLVEGMIFPGNLPHDRVPSE